MVSIEVGALGTITNGLVKRLKNLQNQRTSRDHPDYSITKICQNTEKSPEDLSRLAVSQIPVKNHQLTLV